MTSANKRKGTNRPPHFRILYFLKIKNMHHQNVMYESHYINT